MIRQTSQIYIDGNLDMHGFQCVNLPRATENGQAVEYSQLLEVINETLSEVSMGVITVSSSTDISIPAGTWLKDVNIFVLSGNPVINIPDLNTGDMIDSEIYRYPADKRYSVMRNLHIDVTGTAPFSIKIQLVKYNI